MARMLGANTRHRLGHCSRRRCQWCGLTRSDIRAYRPVQRRRERRQWRREAGV